MPWPVRSSLQCNGQRTGGGNRCLAFYYRCNIFLHATAVQDKETLSLQRRAVQLHAAKANTESGHQVFLPPLTDRSVALPLCRQPRLPSPYRLRKPPQPSPHAYVSYHLSDFFLPIFSRHRFCPIRFLGIRCGTHRHPPGAAGRVASPRSRHAFCTPQ